MKFRNLFFFSAFILASSSLAEDEGSKEDSALKRLDQCQKERWTGWCSEKNSQPDIDPTPESLRSVRCARTSLDVYAHLNSANAMSSVADSNQAGNAAAASQNSATARATAEEASGRFAECKSSTERLKKYLDLYSRDKEAAHSMCARFPKGGNEASLRHQLQNFDNAVRYHKDLYVSSVQKIAKDLEIPEEIAKQFKIDRLSKSTDQFFAVDVASTLSEIRKDCEKGSMAAAEQVKQAAASKSIADKQIGTTPSAGAPGETKKKGLVDQAGDKIKEGVKNQVGQTTDAVLQKGGDELRQKTGLAAPAPSVQGPPAPTADTNNTTGATSTTPATGTTTGTSSASSTKTPAPSTTSATTTGSSTTPSLAPVVPKPTTSSTAPALTQGAVTTGTAALGPALQNLKNDESNLDNTVASERTTSSAAATERLKQKCATFSDSAQPKNRADAAARMKTRNECQSNGFAMAP
jgi:hypothetical protein